MLSIYICEDNPVQLAYYEQIISNFILIEDYDMKIQAAVTGPDALLAVAKQTQQEIDSGGFYLLDIDLRADIDGLELAQKIRCLDPRAFIVFITTHSEMAMLTFQYQVEALDFILKDENWNLPARIHACLVSAQERYQSAPQSAMITFKSGTHIIQVEQNNILYITATGTSHKIQVVTKNGIREFYGTLKSCASVLNENFIRCHKAIIVNLSQVTQVDRKTCTLTFSDGQTCIASTRGIIHVLNALN